MISVFSRPDLRTQEVVKELGPNERGWTPIENTVGCPHCSELICGRNWLFHVFQSLIDPIHHLGHVRAKAWWARDTRSKSRCVELGQSLWQLMRYLRMCWLISRWTVSHSTSL